MKSYTAECWATLKLAGPTTLTHLGALVIGTTDVIMMGWLSPEALAAGTLANSLVQIFIYFGVGLLGAVAPLVARARGARRLQDIPVLFQQNMLIAFLFSLPALAILLQAQFLLTALQQPSELVGLAWIYLQAALFGFLPSLFTVVQKSLLIAVERPAAAWIVVFIAALFNGMSNYALMFGNFGFPALGLFGAGITSAITLWLMFLALTAYIFALPSFRRLILRKSHALAPEPPMTDRIARSETIKVGLPMAFMNFGEVGAFLASSFLFGLFGAQALAAHALALQVSGISYCFALGLSKAASVRVGFAAGADRRGAAFHSGTSAIGLSVIYALSATILLAAGAATIATQFFAASGSDASEATELAVTYLILVGILQIFDAPNITAAGALRGLRDTFWPAVYNLVGYWVIGPVFAISLGFGLGWQGTGVWIGLDIAIAIVAILTVRRWFRIAGKFQASGS